MIRSILAVAFAAAGAALLFVHRPLELPVIYGACLCVGVAGFLADSTRVWGLIQRGADALLSKALGAKES